MTEKIRKDKNQNIQVFIRLRPLNQREKDIKSLGVIEVVNNREVVVRQSQQTTHTKKFTFDRAFGPSASQLQVYQEVVSPLIEEVLNGYNCTVFAYGQTGTGKTHTMVGEHSGTDTHWQNDPLAGIIPRALSQLFDELRLSNTEYTVRVSYLELYNEELFDLLSTSEDNSKLRIYEDVTRKGANIVNGLEEITVYNKNEVYKIMAQGQERKRVASTLMNAQSSRSHTVFTIVVHMKENSPEGEELMKIGKLNLVDLAGSENISKAGSDNPGKKERARECVNINQSLLTLGRVITALVERHPHIPYRESKLTRILQESLGGRTKTSIIATISPGHKDLEETMSTLEYAHRAKNIQNKPEVNQKMTKKAILKEYAEEIDRLKRDLQATRDKNGVYLASETYAEMTLKDEEQRKEIQELLLKKRAMEEERDRMEAVFQELNSTLETKNIELATTVNKLNTTKAQLDKTSHKLLETKRSCEEQEHLVSVHCRTEATLSGQARDILQVADVATNHVQCLHDNVDKRKNVESTNLEVTRTYVSEAQQQRNVIDDTVKRFADTVTSAFHNLQSALDTFTVSSTQTQEQNRQRLENLVQMFVTTMNEIKSATVENHNALVSSTSEHKQELQCSVSSHCSSVQLALTSFLQHHAAALQRVTHVDVKGNVAAFVQQWKNENWPPEHKQELQCSVSSHCSSVQLALTSFLQHHAAALQRVTHVDVKGNVAAFVQQWYSGAAARVSSLQREHATFCQQAAAARHYSTDALRTRTHNRRAHVHNRADTTTACFKEMEDESTRLQTLLLQQRNEIETERSQTETRLQEWAENELKAFQEKIAKHIATEKHLLEERLAKKVADIEVQEKLLESRMELYKKWQMKQLENDREELAMADTDLMECENEIEVSAKELKKYGKEFDEGTNAINIDMEVFSKNVVEVVEHINNEMLRVLEHTREQVEQEVNTVISSDKETCERFVQDTDRTLTSIVDDTKRITEQLLDKIESNNNTAVEQLTHVAASTSQLISSTQSTQHSHATACESSRNEVCVLREQLCKALEELAQLEGRYLSQEYRIYSPTGKTPIRTQYRYPRMLAATSPHERILARFRAMRRHSDDDCVVIDSDPEPEAQSNDSTTSINNDTSTFTVPSPPLDNTRTDRHNATLTNGHIHKSTSESDIVYSIKKENGKENTSTEIYRNGSFKKPSKLPAPSSHKKPLVERNGN